MMFIRDSQKFDINAFHVIGDVQYPIGWFHDAERREALDVFEVPDDADTTNVKRAEGILKLFGEIKDERDRRKFGGVLVSGHWIHSDTFSRTQWIGMVMVGPALPAIEWTCLDGSAVITTPALAAQVFQAVLNKDAILFSICKNHIAAMVQSEDPASYDYSPGWPKMFGE